MSIAASINLVKGGNAALGGIKRLMVGLGWDPTEEASSKGFDLDAACYILGADDKILSSEDFIFYNHLKHSTGCIVHTGDNRTGDGDGDDEVILVDLSKMAPEAQKIVFAVAIYEHAERKQNFSMVPSSFVRICDARSKSELCRFDLNEDFGKSTAVVVGEMYKRDEEWKFRAVGRGYDGDLFTLLEKYE